VSDPAILIRADGSPEIGMGHLMRCLALAEVVGPQATFLCSDPPASFTARAAAARARVRALHSPPATAADLAETSDTARTIGADWIVLDGYGFDGDFQDGLVADGHRVLAIDDHGHAGRYGAHVVLNANAGAEAEAERETYGERAPGTRLLLGLRYALLRAEFRDAPAPPTSPPARARRVAITFGASDPDNVSAQVLEGLSAVPGPLEPLVLVGGANPHGPALRAAADRCPHPVQFAVDVHGMADCLAACDLAVTAAGGTLLELACVGTPAIAIVVADNQEPGARALAAAGAAVNLGRHHTLAPEAIGAAVSDLAGDAGRREALARRGVELVDGQGASRVLAAMHEMAAAGLARR
jgi:UDP-2,4-diacetamido-2,4,6-trideoxy-beta-L-altropyranose hydrolase